MGLSSEFVASIAFDSAVALPQFGGAMLRPCQVCPGSDLARLTEIALILQLVCDGRPEGRISDLLVERRQIAGPDSVQVLGFQGVVQAINDGF
jgi:hypothetical protein